MSENQNETQSEPPAFPRDAPWIRRIAWIVLHQRSVLSMGVWLCCSSVVFMILGFAFPERKSFWGLWYIFLRGKFVVPPADFLLAMGLNAAVIAIPSGLVGFLVAASVGVGRGLATLGTANGALKGGS